MKTSICLAAGAAAMAVLLTVPAGAAPAGQDALYAGPAISAGQYAQAEQILQPASYADARDPARLINLATVYARTERFDAARAVLNQVRQLPDESLDLADGASASSHRIAAAMLKRLP